MKHIQLKENLLELNLNRAYKSNTKASVQACTVPMKTKMRMINEQEMQDIINRGRQKGPIREH